MVDPREEQRAWLRALLEQTGLTPHALAKRARIAPQTLTVFLNSPKATHALRAGTIAALEAATNTKYGPDPRPRGFRERESDPYKISDLQGEPDFIKKAINGHNSVSAWTLKSRALEAAGFLPGDIMIVDQNLLPKPGDIVCAQLRDWTRSAAETVFRIWEPPYLSPATLDAKLRQIFPVDNFNVTIEGVVTTTIRPRQGRTA